MLKTALKPRWILTLILVMALAAVFVLLSQWQFSNSRQQGPEAPAATETVRPLTGVITPGSPLTGTAADQMVSAEGQFLPGTRLLVRERLQGGREGLWLISAFAVDGAPGSTAEAGGEAQEPVVIPVVHGWVPDADAAARVPEFTGPAALTGRLLPAEGPVAADPEEGQVAALATAELVNVWDRPSYAAFIASATITVDGEAVTARAPLEAVEVAPQPQERPVNWLNIFYAVEWVVFAGFAFFLWWRLVADDYRRSLEDDEDDEDDEDGVGDQDEASAAAGTGSTRNDIDNDTASDDPPAAVRAEADDDGASRPGATHPTEAGTRE
ncbi:SURF1 family protein [Arthrobacter sp. MSA 4-2]|uniref:SURF1 family protein n=1 Tax=Arthrobacter sp. MSA 4-2 TaxID=2794349 RepID=UPI0018E87A4D|nr:SURF1 family cytochrome oxidase biogenesis protein [Arthrobacter sp. MSA 4-2]MBJ2120605.1 SURF1 family protein [Arthrobacter sp. MSA 4-2]